MTNVQLFTVSTSTLLSTPGKVFATVLLNSVLDEVLARRRTPLSKRGEFQRPLWVAFVDLKAAFDSVDRMACGSYYTV